MIFVNLETPDMQDPVDCYWSPTISKSLSGYLNTERPVTVDQGTNQLCTAQTLESAVETALDSSGNCPRHPHLWNGRTATRIADHGHPVCVMGKDMKVSSPSRWNPPSALVTRCYCVFIVSVPPPLSLVIVFCGFWENVLLDEVAFRSYFGFIPNL